MPHLPVLGPRRESDRKPSTRHAPLITRVPVQDAATLSSNKGNECSGSFPPVEKRKKAKLVPDVHKLECASEL